MGINRRSVYGFHNVGDGGVMRDVEREEMSFSKCMTITILVVVALLLLPAALFEIRHGDEMKPCNEHEGVNCDK